MIHAMGWKEWIKRQRPFPLLLLHGIDRTQTSYLQFPSTAEQSLFQGHTETFRPHNVHFHFISNQGCSRGPGSGINEIKAKAEQSHLLGIGNR